jgi:SAM-dependent methyltransferase
MAAAMKSYFELRNIDPGCYARYEIPGWLVNELKELGPDAFILDYGCGFGQTLTALKRAGYANVEGVDVDCAAIAFCRGQGLRVADIHEEGDAFHARSSGRFDLILMQHVLEHIPKEEAIPTLVRIREMLRPGGRLILAVPNAQAFTGCYWAYEDFTHYTLFTSGSVYYVLRAADFEDIRFLDIDCSAGLGLVRRSVRKAAWRLYLLWYRLMCALLASYTHAPSPYIFSYEIKAAARNRGSSSIRSAQLRGP